MAHATVVLRVITERQIGNQEMCTIRVVPYNFCFTKGKGTFHGTWQTGLDIEENGLINLVSCAAVHSLRPERYNSCTEVRQAAALYNITGSLLMSIYLTCKLCKLENF